MISALLILAGSAFCGRRIADNQRRKCELCESLLLMITSAENLLRCTCVPIPALMRRLAENDGSPGIVSECSALLERNIPFPEAWRTAVENDGELRHIPEIRKLLLHIGGELGTTGLEGQLASLIYGKTELAAILEKEREKSGKYSGLFPPLGLVAGIWAAIIII